VGQRREPVAAVQSSRLETIIGARSDSELVKQKFAISGSDGNDYKLNDQEIAFATAPPPVAISSAANSSLQLNRSDLFIAQQQSAAAEPLLKSQELEVQSVQSSQLLSSVAGSSDEKTKGGTSLFLSYEENSKLLAFPLLSGVKTKWKLQLPQSSPPIDWWAGKRDKNTPIESAARVAYDVKDIPTDPFEHGGAKRKLGLEGGFGFGGYGSKTVKNTFGLAVIQEDAWKKGNETEALMRFIKDGRDSTPLAQRRLYSTLAATYATTFSYNSLHIRDRSQIELNSVSDNFVVSLGIEAQLRRRYESGGYLQGSIGGSIGYSLQRLTKAPEAADGSTQAMPSWLKEWGLWIGSLGTAEAYLGMANAGLRGTSRYRNMANIDEDSGDTKKDANGKKVYASPGPAYWWIQGINAAAGAATAAAAGLADGETASVNHGLMLSALFNARYLIKGVIGGYVSLTDTYTNNFEKSFVDNTSKWQNVLAADAGAAFPFGVSIPLFAYKLTSPQPEETASLLSAASPSAAADTPNNNSLAYEYLPASGSVLLPGPSASGTVLGLGSEGLDKTNQLRLLSLTGYDKGKVRSSDDLASPVILTNAGSDLTDGEWENVPVLGELLPGSAPATVSFTVLNGKVLAESIEINRPATGDGRYLLLPETKPNSGAYVLIPDVFQQGILTSSPQASGQGFRDLLNEIPVITVRTFTSGSPLTRETIAVIPQTIPLSASGPEGSDPAPALTNTSPSDNSLQTYTGIPIRIAGSSISEYSLTPLNQTTATVGVSNGTIVKVVMEDPIYLSSSQVDALTPWPNITLTLDVQSLPVASASTRTDPSFSVAPQNLGFYNVVEEYSYSANPGLPQNAVSVAAGASSNAQAVWISDGINDQWQQSPSQGAWPVFNRVVVQSSTGALRYLNAFTINANGNKNYEVVGPADVDLESLYTKATNGSDFPHFSAASSPVAIDIAVEKNNEKKRVFTSAVFWVEASDTVIPVSSADNTRSYQDFLTSLYGNQRINYRLYNSSINDWDSPTPGTSFYTPDDAIIRHLKAFSVMVGDTPRTLLVWDETSIASVKGSLPEAIPIHGWIAGDRLSLSGASSGLRIGDLITGEGIKQGTLITGIINAFEPSKGSAVYRLSTSQVVGSSSQPVALGATPLVPPTLLRAGFLNPYATTVQWNDLFQDANGRSTITTIPWDQTNDIGVGIESLSVASQQLINADSGQVENAAVLTWSENVRTPYVESVLNDEPLIYLQFSDLKPGFNDINIGSTASSTTTGTSASSTGLNFAMPSALSKSSGTAVQNIDGTGVIATGTGSENSLYTSFANSTPIDQLPTSPFSELIGSIDGTTLTVTALTGNLAIGDLLTGPGLAPDTKISEVLSSFDPSTGTGIYSINRSQSLTSSTLEAVSNPAPISNKELGLPYSSFNGSITGTILSVSQLRGSLTVGDQIVGEGIRLGTTINAVIHFDPATGTGDYQLSADPLEQGDTLAPSALIGTPSSSNPYTIEFWAKLPAGSNANQGAGLVAFGQPSEQAVGPAIAPSGWLLTSTFTVQRITYQQAATDGFEDAYNALSTDSAKANDLYAWGWSLDAIGANTTALGGDGGSNLYSNALTLTNLYNGQTISGVNTFLASYGLTPEDLVGGDGVTANMIDLVPTTSLEFNRSLNPNTGRPISELSAVNIDTVDSRLNSGLVFTNPAGQISSNASKNQKLQSMFQSLWDYQGLYASAKVAFTLDPADTSTTSASGFEQYGGLPLEFAVSPGPAISVNSNGNLVFDVADEISLTSSATTPSDKRQIPLAADLRDGEWHHIVATYLPDYRTYTINGVVTQIPTNSGTASLFVDNQLVASKEGVTNAYLATNINDIALLLPNNAGGAIDQFALYNKALLPAPPLTVRLGDAWPQPSAEDALVILKQLGYPATEDTPNPGAIESALTEHWRSRDINPNAAVLATFSSTFTPSSRTSLTGSWSEAAPLNPITKPLATAATASAASLQQDLAVVINEKIWSGATWTKGTSTDIQFNPGGDKLRKIMVELTSKEGAYVKRFLAPEQILMGKEFTLATLQPKATRDNLDYTFLSNKPDLSLLISRRPDTTNSESGDLDPSKSYTPTVTITVDEPNSSTASLQEYTTKISSFISAPAKDNRSKALATAAVIEAAPLQLKYIDSGIVLNSTSSQDVIGSPATESPALSFGQSIAYGWFEQPSEPGTDTDTRKLNSGWLAIAQPTSDNAISNPAGRVWVQYTGDFNIKSDTSELHEAVSTAQQAPKTWLNALAKSNFSPESPNRPLLNDATYPASYGGLLIKADPTAGWGQSFGQTMLVEDLNGDGVKDLVISAPSANGGGKVVIIDGNWIKDNLTSSTGSTILNLASPDSLADHVTVLSPAMAGGNEDSSQSAFGWALAFDTESKTLFIGAPNYSRKVGPDLESVPIGAVYRYQSPTTAFNAGNHTLIDPTVGIAGRTDTNDVSGPATSYWGASLGASLAVSNTGALAIGAPGVQASLLYSGTKFVEKLMAGELDPFDADGQGALIKVMLPATSRTSEIGLDVYVSSTEGTNNLALVDIITNKYTEEKNTLADPESAYMLALKEQQAKLIAKANEVNNPAIQTGAVGSVYWFDAVTRLASGTLLPSMASATFYGPNPWNTTGPTDFGASLSFGDHVNTNRKSILAVGAPSTGGSGAVYLLNTSQPFANPDSGDTPRWIQNANMGGYQYLAHLTSALTLYGSEDLDQFGSGLTNLGDTSGDNYDDLLIQAPNASAGAGNGYVVFGTDLLISKPEKGHNPAVGNVRPGSIGKLTFAAGDPETGPITIPILSELGHGISATTGLGSFGAGDVDANGFNDIQLGSGTNSEAYLTYGQGYLEAISNLQLQRLASDNGFLLEGLASTTEGSLRSIGDFNGDGYGDFLSIKPGIALTSVRIELGANTQEILASAPYNYYSFTVANGTQVLPAGDLNGDGTDDIALFLDRNLSSSADGNMGAGSTTGILYGRNSSDLPIGSSLGFLAPVDPTTSAPLDSLPAVNLAGGLTDTAPSVIAVGNTLYAAVRGVGAYTTSLWFSQSRDGGNTWDNWSNLSDTSQAFALKPGTSPSLAFQNDKLVLGFVNINGTLSLSSWDPSSNNSLAWSTPSQLASSSGSSAFTTSAGLQLVDRGDALGVLWVNGGMVQAASSTTPDTTPANSPWEVVNGRSSLATPALARIGGTTYMAVQGGPGDSAIHWTSSSDGGASWAAWRALPNAFTSQKPPSLAVVNGELYLSYLTVGTNQINISSLIDANDNFWSLGYQIPVAPGSSTMQTAQFASLASEVVNGSEQLAVYYVSGDSSNRILKTQSSTPAMAAGWSALAEIKYPTTAVQTGVQTASGPLTVGQFNGQTYLAYQGGTISKPDKAIYIGTSRSTDLNNGSLWAAQRLLDPGQTTGLGLASTASDLQLSYSAASQSGQLQLLNLTPQPGSLNLNQASDPALPLPAGLSANITLLNGVSNGISNQLFAGLSTSKTVETSLVYPSRVNSSWSTPLALQQLLNNEVLDIAADATPSFTWLGTTAVLAVKLGASINVYDALGGGSSLQLTSSFSPQPGAPAIASAPVITTTDTGLALTYTNSDGSITLQRLNLLNSNGTPVAGVQFKDDGSIDVSEANLQWLSTTLDAGTSGISSSLASTPVSVDGTLLLANVRNTTSAKDQIWLDAIPNASAPDSTTWLNTTVQLKDGSGSWAISQQAGADHPVAFGVITPAWEQPNSGLSPWAPSFADLNGVLYSAVRGWNSTDSNKQLYWNRSTDNGCTWSPWQQLPGGMTSDRPPTIAAYNGRLYLAFIGQDNAQTLNLTKLENADTNQWATQITVRAGISGATDQTAEFATLVNEGDKLALYYVGTGKNELYSTSSSADDPQENGGVAGLNGSFTQSTVIKYNKGKDDIQTASGPLDAARLNGKTYLTYQGGTYQSGRNLAGKSNQIFLTTGSADDTNWTLINTIPQPASASHTGVGLTANRNGLVLSYSDVVNGRNVVSVQQGTGSGTSWSFSPYTVLQTPGNSSAHNDGANSLYAHTGSEQVLVGRINPDANEAVTNAWVSPLPPSLVLTAEQTGSTLTPVGDLDNDGYADLLLTANNVVANNLPGIKQTGTQLHTGLRVISGAANSSEFLSRNDSTATSQSLRLADPFSRHSDTPVASLIGADAATGNLTLNLSATLGTTLDRLGGSVAGKALSAQVSDAEEASALLAGMISSSSSLNQANGWGRPELNTGGSYGDLNGDGRQDFLDPAANNAITAADGLTYSLWSIRAAGDVNGNGVDDVLLSLAPQGPAYKLLTNGLPSALQSVLVDGSLFEVVNNRFSLELLNTWSDLRTGTANDDTLSGTDSNDNIHGIAGSDTINSGAGNDILDGGPGNDSLTGGDDADAFQFTTALTSDNVDTLADFAANDTLQLNRAIFSTLTPSTTLSAAEFRSGPGVTAANDASQRILHDTTTGQLRYDSDGIGTEPAMPFAKLNLGAPLSADKITLSSGGLKTSLNPYNRSQLYDLASTSPSAYLPGLQNWFDPILSFEPGALTAAATENQINPDGAQAADSPAVAISPQGKPFLVFAGSRIETDDGLSIAHQDVSGNWQKAKLAVGSDAARTSPSAVFYKGKLVVAYADDNKNLHVAWCDATPPGSAGDWRSYQVFTTAAESTAWNPTLVVEQGRLAMYFPSNAGDSKNQFREQTIRYLYSTDPFNSNANGNWGGTPDATKGYSDISGTITIKVGDSEPTTTPTLNSPIAATSFQGRTILAFRSYTKNTDQGTIQLLTQVASAPTATTLTQSLSWVQTDTGQSHTNGVGLTTDQALLYLTSTTTPASTEADSDPNPEPYIWSLSPKADADGSLTGSWTTSTKTKVDNPVFTDDQYYLYGISFTPFMLNGRLMATWAGGNGAAGAEQEIQNVEIADLNATISPPTQPSLAGFSLDGNIDINGDGFKDILLSDPTDPQQNIDNQYALFGGDYLNIASQVGTSGDDVMVGTPLADVIYTIQGTDQVISNGGADVIYTGAGDDRIAIQDNAFIRIDAGSGFDSLQLQGAANQSFDFRLGVAAPEYFPGTKLRDIELISSIDYGANTLRFDAAAVNAINPDRILFLTPDKLDSVVLSSEFKRNPAFDTTYGGALWNAYAAGTATTPAQSSPTLIYLLNPEGAAATTWLDTQVLTLDTSTSAATVASLFSTQQQATPTLQASTPQAQTQPSPLSLPSPRANTMVFGNNLTLEAYPVTGGSTIARFKVHRLDPNSRQVVTYITKGNDSKAIAGVDFTVATGLVVFEPGETAKDILIPLNPASLAKRGAASVSLAVEEIPDIKQKAVHFLLEPSQDVATGRRPVVSGLELELDPHSVNHGTLSFRIDTNEISSDQLSKLNLRVSTRTDSNVLTSSNSRQISINDFRGSQHLATIGSTDTNLHLDADGLQNQQVQASLRLHFNPLPGQPSVSLLGPEFRPTASVETVGANQIRFLQDAPLTTWRSDSGSGKVTFALQAGATRQSLLTNAIGGSAGSINPAIAINNNPTTGWQGSEGRAIGSRSINTVPNLTTQTWTPTATRDGIDLPLIDIAINGNQITARFADGVTAELWQASGSAPAQLPVAPSLEVQRLAGFNNDIGLYSVDGITGMVDGLNPRDPGYLQAALARSEAEDLLLTAAELPAFGKTTTYNSLPINSQKRYGVLLVQNGNRSTIFSSFSDANPGAETQMVRLGSDTSRFVLGIEDIAVASGRGDRDFNDNIVILSGISLGIL
jgi:hypothetical protein